MSISEKQYFFESLITDIEVFMKDSPIKDFMLLVVKMSHSAFNSDRAYREEISELEDKLESKNNG